MAVAERNDNRSSRHGRASSSSQRSRERRGAPLACALGKQIKQFFFYKKITEIRFVLYSASRQAGRQTHRCAVQWSRAVALVYAGARARRWSRAKKNKPESENQGGLGEAGGAGDARQKKSTAVRTHTQPASQSPTPRGPKGRGRGLFWCRSAAAAAPPPPPPPPQTQATRTLRYAGMNPSVPHAWQWHHPSPTFLPPPASRPPGPGGERD